MRLTARLALLAAVAALLTLPMALWLPWAAYADEPAPEESPPAAAAGEAERVGRLLLDPDPARRKQGEALLLRRIARSGDLTSFVHALTDALRGAADDEDRLIGIWIHQAVLGDDDEREQAVRLITAVGEKAVMRLALELRRRTRGSKEEQVAESDGAATAVPEESERELPAQRGPEPRTPRVYDVTALRAQGMNPVQVISFLRKEGDASVGGSGPWQYVVHASAEGHQRLAAKLAEIRRGQERASANAPPQATPPPTASNPQSAPDAARTHPAPTRPTPIPPTPTPPTPTPPTPTPPTPTPPTPTPPFGAVGPAAPAGVRDGETPRPKEPAQMPGAAAFREQTGAQERATRPRLLAPGGKAWSVRPILVRVPRDPSLIARIQAWPGIPAGVVAPLFAARPEPAQGSVDTAPSDARTSATIVGTPADVRTWVVQAPTLPEARTSYGERITLAPGREARGFVGQTVPYRRTVRQERKQGAWRVDQDILRSGLELRFHVAGGESDMTLGVEARLSVVSRPMATTTFRPEKGAEPIELDRPEWNRQSRSDTLEIPVAGGGLLMIMPDPSKEQTGLVLIILRVEPIATPPASPGAAKAPAGAKQHGG